MDLFDSKVEKLQWVYDFVQRNTKTLRALYVQDDPKLEGQEVLYPTQNLREYEVWRTHSSKTKSTNTLFFTDSALSKTRKIVDSKEDPILRL